MAVVDCVSDTA